MYFILFILILIVLLVSYNLFGKEFISPTVISSAMYGMATICAIVGMTSWNNQSISGQLIIYIILALISFGMGEFVGRKTNKNIEKEEQNLKNINVDKWKIVVIMLFIAITILLMFLEIKKIANNLGYIGNNVSKMISTYRKSSSLFNENAQKEGITINFFVNQMKKICDMLCIIILYVAINNFFTRENIKKYIKKNISLLIVVLLCFTLSLLTSGRAQLMKYIVAALMIYAILLMRKLKLKDFTRKILKVGSIVAIIAVAVFYTIMPLLGRKTDKKFANYITFYLGSSIPSFQRYLQNPPEKDRHFGSETLYGVQNILNKLKISNYTNKISREWTTFIDEETNQKYKSNIYTAVRRYVNDYGIAGVIICPFVFGFCFYKLYEWAKNKKNCRYLIFYAYYSYMLLDQIRDELFFTRFLNINTIINVILVIVLTWIMFSFEFKNIPEYKKYITTCIGMINTKRKEQNENSK